MSEQKQMSEAFRTAAALALVGGFLETYTFMLHGHVFANAQTGNIALCGMALADCDWLRALRYATPVASFALGVGAVEWVRARWSVGRLHWRQAIVFVEAVLLSGCFFLHGSSQDDILANLLVSLACAFQAQAFRKVHGSPYASTMCTGNLRSGTLALIAWKRTRKPECRRQAESYFGVIGTFLLGAALAVPFVLAFREAAIALPIASLVIAEILMSLR